MGEQCPWADHTPATISFCEKRLCEWIVEPSNAWSNLAFILAGIYLLMLARRGPRDSLIAVPITSILVGIGSFAFHATGTLWGETLDVSAMYLISGLFIVFNMRRMWPGLSDRTLIASYAAIVFVSVILLLFTPHTNIPVFAAEVTVAGVLELMLFLKRDGTTKYAALWGLIIAFTAAFSVWIMDIRGRLCDPDNHLFTGHAFWHCANAVCLYYFYKYHEQFRRRA